MLVDALLNAKPNKVTCGANYTVVVTLAGDAYAGGANDNGQCGVGQVASLFSPSSVNFDEYYKPKVKLASAGSSHTAFVDDIGRLFMVGNNDKGQLGIGSTNSESRPFYVTRIPDKVVDVACGTEHTLVLTEKGDVFAMGSNSKGQLGTG